MKTKKRPKNGKKWHQGQFFPQKKNKYKGKYPVIYRSSWELEWMRFCDMNSNILYWASESMVVLYEDKTRQNTKHRYFVDFNMIIKDSHGNIKKYFIEVKPFNQTQPPKNKRAKSYKDSCLTYIRNICKWKAAVKEAKKYGGEFKILTEQGLIDVKF